MQCCCTFYFTNDEDYHTYMHIMHIPSGFADLIYEYWLMLLLIYGCCNNNIVLASCQWGPVTVYGVGILTEMYVMYMETFS